MKMNTIRIRDFRVLVTAFTTNKLNNFSRNIAFRQYFFKSENTLSAELFIEQ